MRISWRLIFWRIRRDHGQPHGDHPASKLAVVGEPLRQRAISNSA
jgi:hypothetical protein